MTGSNIAAEVGWGDLDKRRFFVYGGVIFTIISGALYPLSVLKTHQMVQHQSSVERGNALRGESISETVRKVYRETGGVRGFYRGFPTVVFGSIPSRFVYLSTLEAVKYSILQGPGRMNSGEDPTPGRAAQASFVAGATASLATQLVLVPVDVVSQRQMIYSKEGKGLGFWTVTSEILRRDGFRGLYRGLPISILTYVPSSAIWWSAYGAYQRFWWSRRRRPSNMKAPAADSTCGCTQQEIGVRVHSPDPATSTPRKRILNDAHESIHRGASNSNLQSLRLADQERGQDSLHGTFLAAENPRTAEIVAVQTGAAILAGITSGIVTTPLDGIKTRLQVSTSSSPDASTLRGIVHTVWNEHGWRGFFRGLAPRVLNVSIWGTVMVTNYEILKRFSRKPPSSEEHR
mmetsp:Transcript_1538/g.2971  ORF Transcript_1538/g.2971 Transcript_1538/m.2971 type:complete len:403 (-) Transcript_1538:119-1327(-)|eukprot:CAMPEP_0184686150 /NCGR_PEP_ID=MMETSP0312-20130426/21431_1 /TAXON_ID=31354 /ORGANISM="Compsopogon coeruleus, Strain SAG 36.94" /LENGTH=402 /DNA_ID=CAMNT_0027140933 /DNA_START=138 /DNA_END=1346 /DNA_ORIENTATION=+